jgi:crossover junction endodeoxyribonuclease RuvC
VKITGLDLSLRKTGVAHVFPERVAWAHTYRIAPHARLGEGHERLAFLLYEIGNHTKGSDLILLENLAFSQSTNKASELAGLHWLVRHALWRRQQPYVVVTTQHLKSYATGQGTKVDKDDVLAAMIKRYPEVEIAGNDGADALACAAMGSHKLGFPLKPVPQTHARALAMIKWPPFVAEMAELLAGGPNGQADAGDDR